MSNSSNSSPLLHLDSVHKRFGPVHALKGVELEIYAGEVHALIGENGAGKSTLMKVLSGAHQPSEGNIKLDGENYLPHSPLEGRMAGVAMIYQELTLAPHLSIEENINLGMENSKLGFVKHDRQKINEALKLLGQGHFSPSTIVSTLSIGTRQLIEIARAIVNESRIVIMDEPTSSLSSEDTQALFRVIEILKKKGLAIIYISHFLEEVKDISDRYTILRDGLSCGTGMMNEVSIPQIVEMMVGRSMDDMYPKVAHNQGDVVLEVDGLRGYTLPLDVSFSLRKGEILGIFGLVGAGRSELLRCLFGLDPISEGEVTISGKKINTRSHNPRKALELSLDLLSEDRKTEGLAQNMSIAANTTLSSLYHKYSSGMINLKEEKQEADVVVKKMRTKCHQTIDAINTLSGGNQQKVAIARLLHHGSSILMMDEPTRGIDVGSKSEIYGLIQQLASEGNSIIFVSSYLPELQGVCDSLAVMYRGRLGKVRDISECDEHSVMLNATTGSL